MKRILQILIALMFTCGVAMAQTTVKPGGTVSISTSYLWNRTTDSVYLVIPGSPVRYYNVGIYGKINQSLADSLQNKATKDYVNTTYPVSLYQWTKTNEGTTAHLRDGAALVQAGDYLFSLGGWNPALDPKTDSEVYRFSRDLSATTQLSNAPWEGRHTFGFAQNGNNVYVFGGDVQRGHYQKDAWRGVLQPDSTLTWTEINSNLPWGERVLFGSVTHNNAIYVIGGQDSTLTAGVGFGDVWRSIDWGATWTQIATGLNQFKKNMYGTVTSFNGYIYAISGGQYDDTPTYSKEVWRSRDGITWARMEDIPFPGRQYPAVLTYQNKIFLTSGANSDIQPLLNGNLNDTYAMDVSGRWAEVKDLNENPTPRHATAFAVYNDQLVISTGNFYTENNTWTLSPASSIVTANKDGFATLNYLTINSQYSGGLVINKQNLTDGLSSYIDYYNQGVSKATIGLQSDGNFRIQVKDNTKDLFFMNDPGFLYKIYHEGNTVSSRLAVKSLVIDGYDTYESGKAKLFNTAANGTFQTTMPGTLTDYIITNSSGGTIWENPHGTVDAHYYGKAIIEGAPVDPKDAVRRIELDTKEDSFATLSVSKGGTGRSTVTVGAILKGNATGALQDAVSGADYVAPSTTITAGNGLSGGGNLSTNRTISADTTVLQTKSNSLNLVQLQTRLAGFGVLNGGNTWIGNQNVQGNLTAGDGGSSYYSSLTSYGYGAGAGVSSRLELSNRNTALSTNIYTLNIQPAQEQQQDITVTGPSVSGTMALLNTVSRTLATYSADVATSGTGQTDLYTYTIPANTMVNDGDRIVAKFYVDLSATSSPAVRFYVDGNSLINFADALSTYSIDVVIIRTGSTSARISVGRSNSTPNYFDVSSFDWTAAEPIKITGQTATGSITAKMGTIEYKPAAL